ncbi:MAG: bifunctional serine/threonine-protein kinase/formylglycine-generating enzyme family protein [Planctomycetota bacterium]|jgi:serine/threonine protein kinase
MATTCQRCGKENAVGVRYCGQCSYDMTSGVTLQTPPVAESTLTSAQSPLKTDTLIGREIGGCVIETKIGQGGMGAVYRGMQTSLKRPVAIKILPEHLASNSSYIARFLKESEIVASIRHPNIVSVYDRGQAGSIFYFIMEFIEGRTASSLVLENGPLPAGDALEIMRQAAFALATAAAKGIIHRDIKPDNIMIDRGGLVKVTDFGLVKNTAETTGGITATHQVMGTPAFMSPEQCHGEIVDNRSDIYSLGMTFYMLLAGKPAYTAETTMALMLKHINEEPQPIHIRNPNAPGSVWPVMQRMLAKNPAHRFPDWPSVLQAFAQLAVDYPGEYVCSDLLRRMGSDETFVAGLATNMPTPRPTPTVDPQTLNVVDPVATQPFPQPQPPQPAPAPAARPPSTTAPPAYMQQTTPTVQKSGKPLLTGLAVLVIVILAGVGAYFIFLRSPDAPEISVSADVQKLAEEIKEALRLGDFNASRAKLNSLRDNYGDSGDSGTMKAFRDAEETLARLEPEWKKYHKALNDARKLQEEGRLADARSHLLEAKKLVVEVNVHLYLDNAVMDLEKKMTQMLVDAKTKAEKLGEQNRWDEAVKILDSARSFTIDVDESRQVARAIAAAEEKKKVSEQARQEKRYSDLLNKAREALAKRDLESVESRLAELGKLRPDDPAVLEISDRLRFETLIAVPAGKISLDGRDTNVPGFEIGAHEVTNRQYREFIDSGGYSKKVYWSGEGWLWKVKNHVSEPQFWDDSQFSAPLQPVVGISWYEAEAFCSWLSEVSANYYRLPTLAEWERAAVGPVGAAWPWGSETENPPANLRCRRSNSTVTVGSYAGGKSIAGCFDMIGNVSEWCNAGRKKGFLARGGSWLTDLDQVTAHSSRSLPPATRSNRIGFRFIREVE